MTYLWYAGIALLALVAFVIIAIYLFVESIQWYANKMMFGLPWLKWLTMEDVVDLGYSRFYARGILPMFYKAGNLEVRVKDNLEDWQLRYTETLGFCSMTIGWYKFKITKRGGRKRWREFSLNDIFPSPLPAPKPV